MRGLRLQMSAALPTDVFSECSVRTRDLRGWFHVMPASHKTRLSARISADIY